MVVGIAEKRKTAKAFREACDVFEVLGRKNLQKAGPNLDTPDHRSIPLSGGIATKGDAKEAAGSGMPVEKVQPRGTENGATPTACARFLDLVQKVVGNGKPKWRQLSLLSEGLHRLDPKIRYSEFGKPKLGELLQTFPDRFETRGNKGPKEFRLLERFSPEARGLK